MNQLKQVQQKRKKILYQLENIKQYEQILKKNIQMNRLSGGKGGQGYIQIFKYEDYWFVLKIFVNRRSIQKYLQFFRQIKTKKQFVQLQNEYFVKIINKNIIKSQQYKYQASKGKFPQYCYDKVQKNNFLYMIMPKQGKSIKKFLEDQKEKEKENIRKIYIILNFIFKKLCQYHKQFQKKSLCFRDVKFQNILLKKELDNKQFQEIQKQEKPFIYCDTNYISILTEDSYQYKKPITISAIPNQIISQKKDHQLFKTYVCSYTQRQDYGLEKDMYDIITQILLNCAQQNNNFYVFRQQINSSTIYYMILQLLQNKLEGQVVQKLIDNFGAKDRQITQLLYNYFRAKAHYSKIQDAKKFKKQLQNNKLKIDQKDCQLHKIIYNVFQQLQKQKTLQNHYKYLGLNAMVRQIQPILQKQYKTNYKYNSKTDKVRQIINYNDFLEHIQRISQRKQFQKQKQEFIIMFNSIIRQNQNLILLENAQLNRQALKIFRKELMPIYQWWKIDHAFIQLFILNQGQRKRIISI